jgi:hypothetical protein
MRLKWTTMAKTASRCILVVLASTYFALLLLSSHVALTYAPETHARASQILKNLRLYQNWDMFFNPKRGLVLTEVAAIDQSGHTFSINFIPHHPVDVLGINSQYWRLIARANTGKSADRARTDLARYFLKPKQARAGISSSLIWFFGRSTIDPMRSSLKQESSVIAV